MRDEREGEEGESHADEGEGMRRRYPARRSLELGGGARKRQELTAVSNLSVQRYIILILTRRERKKKQKKTYQSEKEKDKKNCAEKINCEKNMVNVAAYFETSFKHVTINTRDNPTRDEHEGTRVHTLTQEFERHHTSYCIFYCKALNVSSNNSIIL